MSPSSVAVIDVLRRCVHHAGPLVDHPSLFSLCLDCDTPSPPPLTQTAAMVLPILRKKRAPAPMWKYIEVKGVDGKRVLSCAAPLCTQYNGKSDNATRAKEHLLECAAARALPPDIRADLLGVPVSVGGTGAIGAASHGSTGAEILLPLAPFALNDWEQQCAVLIFGGELPISVFHSPQWRSIFFLYLWWPLLGAA